MDQGKEKSLDVALKQIERLYGKGAIMRLGDAAKVKVPVIPTGSIKLNAALGIGGYPRGRVVEIYGPEASGKTTLALHAIAEVQKAGGIAAFIDAEHALDPSYAERLGVKIDDLYISQPDTGEQALDIAEVLVRSGAVDLIVVDSVAALVPKAEIEGEMGEAQVGLQARLMSKAMRKLVGVLSKSRTCAIFINQVRHKIGVMFGNPETTPGGLALKFHSSIRLEIRRIATIKVGDQAIGNRVKVKVVKNKLAPPFRECEFDIVYGKGISKEEELLDLGLQHGLVKKSGTWYSYKDKQLGQGKENARRFLEEHPEIRAELENLVMQELGLVSANKGEGES
ncbi:MAG: recombinase RecA [Candidatus Hydrothermota bacterium]|nr:MAG: recombinase RecA [Candidatus Hydrothermae bacterium]